jgi:nucleoside-diphosphate-sugar epimerase
LEHLHQLPGFTFTRGDISERDLIPTLVAQGPFNAVINLAARAGVRTSVLDPWVYVNTNMIGTLNLLEICRQTGTPKFILASTSSIYGANAPPPPPPNPPNPRKQFPPPALRRQQKRRGSDGTRLSFVV